MFARQATSAREGAYMLIICPFLQDAKENINRNGYCWSLDRWWWTILGGPYIPRLDAVESFWHQAIWRSSVFKYKPAYTLCLSTNLDINGVCPATLSKQAIPLLSWFVSTWQGQLWLHMDQLICLRPIGCCSGRTGEQVENDTCEWMLRQTSIVSSSGTSSAGFKSPCSMSRRYTP